MIKILLALIFILSGLNVSAADRADVVVKNFFAVKFSSFESGGQKARCKFFKKYFDSRFIFPSEFDPSDPAACILKPGITRYPQFFPFTALAGDDNDPDNKPPLPKLISVKVEKQFGDGAVVSAFFSKGDVGEFNWPAVRHLFYLKNTENGWKINNIIWQTRTQEKGGRCAYDIFDDSQKEVLLEFKRMDGCGGGR